MLKTFSAVLQILTSVRKLTNPHQTISYCTTNRYCIQKKIKVIRCWCNSKAYFACCQMQITVSVMRWKQRDGRSTVACTGTSRTRLPFHYLGSDAEAVWGGLSLSLLLDPKCGWKSYQAIFLDSGFTGSMTSRRLDWLCGSRFSCWQSVFSTAQYRKLFKLAQKCTLNFWCFALENWITCLI